MVNFNLEGMLRGSVTRPLTDGVDRSQICLLHVLFPPNHSISSQGSYDLFLELHELSAELAEASDSCVTVQVAYSFYAHLSHLRNGANGVCPKP